MEIVRLWRDFLVGLAGGEAAGKLPQALAGGLGKTRQPASLAVFRKSAAVAVGSAEHAAVDGDPTAWVVATGFRWRSNRVAEPPWTDVPGPVYPIAAGGTKGWPEHWKNGRNPVQLPVPTRMTGLAGSGQQKPWRPGSVPAGICRRSR